MGSNTTRTGSHEPKCTILHQTLILDLTGLEQSRHLETSFISSMIILSVVFGVMNVAAWSGVSLIACQVPFRHMSCQKTGQVIHGPLRARCKKCLTICKQASESSPTLFNSWFLSGWSSKQGVNIIKQIICWFVCKFAMTFNSLLCMTLHVVTL